MKWPTTEREAEELRKKVLKKKEKGGRKKMKKVKIAHLAYQVGEEMDENGVWVRTRKTITRYTNPIVDGRFTGAGWFCLPEETELSPQELADKYNEPVFSVEDDEYYYPRKQL